MEDIKMKKTYIKPQMKVFDIDTPNLCGVSGDNTRGSASIYTEGGKVDADQALSREGGLIWELEEVSEEE